MLVCGPSRSAASIVIRVIAAAVAMPSALSVCGFPTDRSDEISVTIDVPRSVVLRGETMALTARVWQRNESGLAELGGATVAWDTEDPSVATVETASPRGARLTGVGPGTTSVRATALDYEDAQPGVVSLRIANAVEIDSVRPLQAHYGEQLTVYGVGLGRVTQVSLAGTPLILDDPSLAGDPDGVGSLRFWLPFPAASGVVSAVVTEGVATAATESTTVIPSDIYDDVAGPAVVIDLGGSVLRPPDTLFTNPALVLRSEATRDAYRLSFHSAPDPVSLIISTALPIVFGFEPVLLPTPTVPSVYPEDFGPEWSMGVAGQHCHEAFVSFGDPLPRTTPVTIVRAFRQPPSEEALLGIYGGPPGRYGISAVRRYVLGDPAIPMDRFEDNDLCVQADAMLSDPDRRIDPLTPFSDTLTIDNAYEVDWFRFTVPESASGLLTIRAISRPFGAADSSNLGLALRPVDDLFDGLFDSHAEGPEERLALQVVPGDYYLAVTDDAGVPTRYSLCITIGADCGLIGLSGSRMESGSAIAGAAP
jgi:hypothetical protein